jgi:hypothetical protein
MKVHAATLGFLALSATLGFVIAQDRPAQEPTSRATDGSQTKAPQERESDVQAIGDLVASFVKAYNARDAKGLAALFTLDAEIEDEDGDVTRGLLGPSVVDSEHGFLRTDNASLTLFRQRIA